MTCPAKHTVYQPTDAEFRCPRCEASCGIFCIDNNQDDADSHCPKLHPNDRLICYGKKDGNPCHYETSGRAFAARLAKAKNIVPCPYCRGTGVAKRGARRRAEVKP